MRKFRNVIAISAFSLMVLALPNIASAQWGNNRGYGYPNQGNRGYVNMEQIADRIKDRSKDFERAVDRDRGYNNNNNRGGILGTILNNGRYGNNRGYSNNNMRRLAEDFRRAANDFENRADDRGRDQYRAQEAANRMLSIASQIDRELYGYGRNSNLQYQWQGIRSDLNVVAQAYGGYNRGGRNNGRFPF